MSSGDYPNHCNSLDGERALKNWAKWQDRWRKHEIKVADVLDRNPEDNLTADLDTVHRINQEKMLLEYAKIETYFDKYRGKPDFWRLPAALAQKPNQPTYFAVKTKPDGYKIPKFVLIGYPEEIQYERNVLDDSRRFYERWQNMEYRRQQQARYQRKIDRILPHFPDFNDLQVIGREIEPPEDVSVASGGSEEDKEPQVTEEEKELIELFLKKTLKVKPIESKLEFQINGILFNVEQCKNLGNTKRRIYINFEYDLSEGGLGRIEVPFVNSGTKTVRVAWKKQKKFLMKKRLTCDKCDPNESFCFNKNELLVLPGETNNFPVFIRPMRAGNYVEEWEMMVKPELWHPDYHVVLSLHCYAYYKNMKEQLLQIMKFIDEESRVTMIHNILDKYTKGINYAENENKPCLISRERLFEIVNTVNGRPFVLYNEETVNTLAEFYDNVRTEAYPKTWNYSIELLQKMARVKDISQFLENKKNKSLTNLFKQEVEVATPKKEKSTKADKKGKKNSPTKAEEVEPVKTIVFQNVVPEKYIFDSRITLNNILKKLDHCVITHPERVKMAVCTLILSFYFAKMEDLLVSLETDLNITRNTRYPPFVHQLVPINELPDGKIYEQLDYTYFVPDNLPVGKFAKQDKPKPKSIQDVTDIETIYCTYFNTTIKKPDTKQGKDDTKSKKGSEKKKETKSTGKSSKGAAKALPKCDDVFVPDFDPFEDFIFTPVPDKDESAIVPFEEEELPPEIEEEYRYQSYLIVYTCLQEAVDAIIDTVNSFDCVVPHHTLDHIIATTGK